MNWDLNGFLSFLITKAIIAHDCKYLYFINKFKISLYAVEKILDAYFIFNKLMLIYRARSETQSRAANL